MTFQEAVKRMLSRPDKELAPWALLQKYSRRSFDSIAASLQMEIRSVKQCRIVAQRSAPAVTDTRAEARKRALATLARYPELNAEEIARAKLLGYNDDEMNLLRLAAIGERIRSGRAR